MLKAPAARVKKTNNGERILFLLILLEFTNCSQMQIYIFCFPGLTEKEIEELALSKSRVKKVSRRDLSFAISEVVIKAYDSEAVAYTSLLPVSYHTPRPTPMLSAILIHPAVWPQQTWTENWGGCAPFLGRGAGSPSNTVALAEAYLHTKWLSLLHI